MQKVNLEFNSLDLEYLANTLNEVLNGFYVPDWGRVFSFSRDEAENLLKRLSSEIESAKGSAIQLSLSRAEVLQLVSSSNLCTNELDEAEFQTRTGKTISHADLISKRLVAALV